MTLANRSTATTGVDHGPLTWSQLLLSFLIVNVLLAAAVGLLRLLDVVPLWIGDYAKIMNAIAVGIACADLMTHRRLHIDGMTLAMFLVIPLGVVVGALADGEFRYFVAHSFAALFAVVLYSAGRNADLARRWLDRWLSFVAGVTVVAYAISLGAFYAIDLLGAHRLYPGVGTGDLVLSVSYYTVKGRWRLVALCVSLIFISGKRGPLLAVLVVLMAYASLRHFRSPLVGTVATAGAALAVVVGFFLMQPLIDFSSLPRGLDSVVAKVYALNPLSEGFDFGVASSGRWSEIEWAFADFNLEPGRWLVGAGYGWSYFNGAVLPGTETRDYVQHYVHLSPLNYLYLYGLPAAMVILLMLASLIARAYVRASELIRSRDTYPVVALGAVGALVVGLTGYSYAVDPMLWVVIGLAANPLVYAPELRPKNMRR